ncbi:MAG: DNA-3-methyladenine glycosylase [Bacteroidota bacterium]
MEKLLIELPADFNQASCLQYLDRSPLELLHKVVEEDIYKLVPITGAEPLLLRLRFVSANLLQAEFANRSSQESEKKLIQNYIEQWWDLERDLAPFYGLAERDPLLGKALVGNRGLRLMGVPDLFEALCWSIIGQQINLPFAYQLKGRLVENYGQSYEWEGKTYWLFPEPSAIANASVEALFALKITRRKCEYLIGVAQAMLDGKLSKAELLAERSAKAAEKKLVAQRGIGPWSANYVMMRCLRYPDAYPVGDAGLQNSVKRLLMMERKPTELELYELAEPWTGWEAYATFYLWAAK